MQTEGGSTERSEGSKNRKWNTMKRENKNKMEKKKFVKQQKH
jgi:hypothetical protein